MNRIKYIALGGCAFLPFLASATDDIATVTTSVSGYVTAATAVGVAVMLFVLGRKVLKRLV